MTQIQTYLSYNKNDFLNKISSFQYSKSLFRMFVNVSIVSCKIRALKENKPTYMMYTGKLFHFLGE